MHHSSKRLFSQCLSVGLAFSVQEGNKNSSEKAELVPKFLGFCCYVSWVVRIVDCCCALSCYDAPGNLGEYTVY